jgi:hypothetical protein
MAKARSPRKARTVPESRAPGRKPRPRGGPYDDAKIGEQIEHWRLVRDMKVQTLCDLMNTPDPEFPGIAKWDDGVWSRKRRGETPMWGAEIGKLARILDMPPGCPYIEPHEGALLRAIRSDTAVGKLVRELLLARAH